jgi:triphosphoribosyl-dephospho-CoA synthase
MMLRVCPRLDPRVASAPAPLGRLAIRSLHAELVLAPKPGLVSPLDSGSHRDMTAMTFMRSLFALRRYFADMATAGARDAAFCELQRLGIAAEQRMLAATGGINTHRGAVFSLGLLVAAAAWRSARGLPLAGCALGQTVQRLWGAGIRSAVPRSSRLPSHGMRVARRFGAGGARAEAVAGFPTLFEVGLPCLHDTLRRTGRKRLALLQALFSLVSCLEDTNLLYRGGSMGLLTAQRAARGFLEAGGVFRPDWEHHALTIHRDFVALDLSPGGSADLLASTWFVHCLQDGSV